MKIDKPATNRNDKASESDTQMKTRISADVLLRSAVVVLCYVSFVIFACITQFSGWIVWTVGLLFATIIVIYLFIRGANKKSNKSNQKTERDGGWGWTMFFVGGLVALASQKIGWDKRAEREKLEERGIVLPGAGDGTSNRASNSRQRHSQKQADLNYWRVAVANLHQARFSSKIDESQSTQQINEKFTKLVEQAENTDNGGISKDLKEMAERHLQFDRKTSERLNLFNQKYAFLRETGQFSSMSEQEAYELLVDIAYDPDLLENFEDPQTRGAVLELSQWLASNLELTDENLHEIQIMQAKLEERHNCKFPLPDIE